MKKTKLLTFLLGLAACLATANLPAQSPALYQIVISGVCWDTNANGAIVSTPLNNRTLLRDVARASGNADYSSWGLAYHFHGSELGDTIDVIDREYRGSSEDAFRVILWDRIRPDLDSERQPSATEAAGIHLYQPKLALPRQCFAD